MKSSSDFYFNEPEPNQSCFLALRKIILGSDDRIQESVKYGMPCFTLLNKAFLYLWKDKKTKDPYLLWVDGNLLDHPSLEKGNRARMKILRVNPLLDLPVVTIRELIENATLIIEKRA